MKLKPNPNHVHLVFEDDVTLHNRMIDSMQSAMTSRTVTSLYELNDTKEAIQALAKLIKAKADKQRMLIEGAVEDFSDETN